MSNMPGGGTYHGRNESTASAGRPTSPSISRATSSSPTATSMPGWSSTTSNGRFLKAVGTRGNGQPPVRYAAFDRDRLPGQRLRRRSRQCARPGPRQRPELESQLHERRQSRGRCASPAGPDRRTRASSSLRLELMARQRARRGRRDHRRGLQDGARRHDRRQVRHAPERRPASSRRSTRWTAATRT